MMDRFLLPLPTSRWNVNWKIYFIFEFVPLLFVFFNLTKHLPFLKKLNGRLFVIISRYTIKRSAFIGLDSIFVAPPFFSMYFYFFSKSWAQNIDGSRFSFTGLIISGIEFIFILKKGKYIFILRTEFSWKRLIIFDIMSTCK